MKSPLNRLVNPLGVHRKTVKQRIRKASSGARRALLFEGLEERRLLAVVARVVEDSVALGGINNGDLSSTPSAAVDVGGVVYFAADDGIHGRELWRVDPAGLAELVEDSIAGGGIAAGAAASNPGYLTNFNGTLFFSASDGANGIELWKVGNTGTAELVAGGINPGAGSSNPSDLEVVGTSLYFVATDSTNGRELWRTDSAGVAELVEDSLAGGGIRSGFLGSSPAYLTNVSGQLFFQASDGFNGYELWRVQNGGLASMVEDSLLGGGIAPGFSDSNPSGLYNFNGTLYFAATNDDTGTELWRVSGTGTAQLVEDSIPGDGIAIGSSSSYPGYLASSNGTLYFQATNDENGSELWRIGSSGKAEVVEIGSPNGGINPGPASSIPTSLVDISGTLYFQAKNDANGYELWRVNSLGLASLVDDNQPGLGIAPGTGNASPSNLTNVGGTLYFSANDGSQGVELWRIPTPGGFAEIVEDNVDGGGIAVGAASSNPTSLFNANGKLVFSARNAAQGVELWQIDNTGLARVVENSISGDGINPNAADSNPTQLSFANGHLYFSANDGTHGVELWRFDGALAADQISVAGNPQGINRISASSSPKNLTLLNGTLYFVASDGTNGTELWRINGSGVAEIVEDSISGGGLRAGSLSSNPRDLTEVNGTVYFSADTSTGTGLWRIQASGLAQLVVEHLSSSGIETGPLTPRSSLLTNANGTLYFVAADSLNGNELWRVNALSGQAELVEDNVAGGGLNPGPASSNPNLLINVNGTLFFSASNPAAGEELWRVDSVSGEAGLVEDVVPLDGLYPGAYSSSPKQLTNFGGTLYFQANDGTSGRELWRVAANGVAQLVEDNVPLGGINPNFGSYPDYLTTVGGTLYFQANDGTTGDELWRVDGTGVAARVDVDAMGGDINPGIARSNPRELTNVNGTLFFRANSADHGYELWRVNASGNAVLVEDAVAGGGIRPGPGSSAPSNLVNANGTLYFQANDGTNGFELWRVNGFGTAEIIEDSLLGGGLTVGSQGSYPNQLTDVNGRLYFTATDSDRGRELWTVGNSGPAMTLGGEEGNDEIFPGAVGSSPSNLTNVNGVLYLSADAGPRFGVELMKLKLNTLPTLTRNNPSVSGDVLTPLVNAGTWNDLDGDLVTLTASLGNVIRNPNGTWGWSYTPTGKLVDQIVQITATDIHGDASNVTFTISAEVRVLNRQVFYNRALSAVFGNGSANPLGSIDATKSALLPGQTTTFAHYTNYRLGLNGLVVDVAGLGAAASAGDFRFATWNGIDAAGFVSATAVPTMTVFPGGGMNGSTRVKIEFADNAIQNKWLRVTLLGNTNTGLAADDTFYFGNAIGDMNDGNIGNPITVRVNATDTGRVRQNQSTAINSVGVTNYYDLNKDGRVNATDTAIVRQNQASGLIRFFTAPTNLQLALATDASVPSILAAPGSVGSSGLGSDAQRGLESDMQLDKPLNPPTDSTSPGTINVDNPTSESRYTDSPALDPPRPLSIAVQGHSPLAWVWLATDQFFAAYP